MVWFQCECCGDNLKKPKLPNHFRMCSASKEKYCLKGQGKAINGSNANPNSASKQKPDIDLSVGLSKSPPWSCSVCNTKVTSQQTLLLHAEEKKHIAKAKTFHAATKREGNDGANGDLKSTKKRKLEASENVELGNGGVGSSET